MDDFIRPVKQEKKPKKKGFIKEILIIILIVVCLSIGFITGYMSKKTNNVTTSSNSDSVVDEVYQTLKDHWVNASDQDVDIVHSGLSAFVAGLGDIHSSYMTSEEANSFNESVNGNYQGIGVGYSAVSNGVMLTKIYEDSPAQKANLAVGDILLKADDHDLAGLDNDTVKQYVRGQEGTTVHLTYLRGDKTSEVDVERQSLDTSVAYEIRENNGIKFGFLSITTFGSDTASRVGEALEEFRNKNIGNLVLDLRGNGGGYLTAAIDILNYFFDSNDVIYQMEEKNSGAVKTYAKDDNKYNFTNGYILVNGSTASASELTAGTLQQELNFKLIGEQTYGKGTAQVQKKLSDGSVLKYTYARWMLPDGTCINGEGLTPDIEIANPSISKIKIQTIKTPLSYDCVNTNIKSMQKMLKILGYDCGREDGYFSSQTVEVLKTFEGANGLNQDGNYDESDKLMLIAKVMVYINNNSNDLQYNKLLEELK